MISTIIGIGLFVATIAYTVDNQPDTFSGYIEMSSLVLLIFAPISVGIIAYGIIEFFLAFKALFAQAFLNQKKEIFKVANTLTALNQQMKQEGLGALVKARSQIKHQIFRDGIGMITNGFSTAEINHNMNVKIEAKQVGLTKAAELYDMLARTSPGMGLLGTVLGLIQMLSNLDTPEKIGGGMAVSLLSTLYGIIFGNVIYQPLSEQIFSYTETMEKIERMILEGVIALKDNKSNVHFQDIISTFTNEPIKRKKKK
jgi:chemotaxis protein MotA